ncbi:MAG TPA: TonB-dependent receptor plug domain-containing protein, partial [Ferruginibacter sp.]|nr:TonB-dependent receptor plug domain-containing protein [Ferruginibacter sp.]
MKPLITLLFFITAFLPATAQENSRGKVKVSINNNLQSPQENVTVELRKAKDSSLVKVAITDKNGQAEFENIRMGSYFIKTALVNYKPQYSATFAISAEQSFVLVPSLTLQPAAAELSGVTVTGRKPFIQKLADRIVVNVENSIVSAGSTAMDVLERSPGVNIDQNDNITLRGKSGVIIMVDGKPSPMTGADLANFLKGLPSSALERIDIITNPSAKY